MRKLLFILFCLPVLLFGQVYISTGGSTYFNVKVNDGSVIGYPKDQYEIVQDNRGWIWLRNIHNARNITAERDQSIGVYFDKWRINGATPASAVALIDSLTNYIYTDAQSVVNVISGTADNGDIVPVSITDEGHLETELHAPLNPFGSVHTESLFPIMQGDAVYGIDSSEVNLTIGRLIAGAGSATITNSNNMFTCSTGTTSYSYSVLQSNERVRYRAGQGVVGRFAGYFSEPVANSYLIAGFGTAESGLYFAYRNDTFGILHTRDGLREIQTLTITVGSSHVDTVTITLNSIAYNVPVTNSASTLKTAYEISTYNYVGWDAEQVGSTVVFVAADASNKAGTFTLTDATSAVGTFAETTAGRTTVDNFIPQTSWNRDKLDGTGTSGFILDPQKGNVYQINIQYLGFGTLTFKVETVSGNNNPTWTTVHVIEYPNTATVTSLTQPSFPFTMSAYSAGSTTNVSVSVGSYGGFIEGQKVLNGSRLSYIRETNGYVGSTASTYYPMFTIRNDRVNNNRANQSVTYLLSASLAHDDATPVSLYIIKNATLGGTPNFTKFSIHEPVYIDVASTTATITDPDKILFTLQAGQNSAGLVQFGDLISVQPGETITIACRAVTGTATYVNASLNTRDDE